MRTNLPSVPARVNKAGKLVSQALFLAEKLLRMDPDNADLRLLVERLQEADSLLPVL